LIWQLAKKKQSISVSYPDTIDLAAQELEIDFSATSGLPVQGSSLVPKICTLKDRKISLLATGYCIIRFTQLGNKQYSSAVPREIKLQILGNNEIHSNTRVLSDQPDSVTGFQVKAIYVIASDGIDHSYDTNGYIDGILDEGNKFLRTQLGLQIPIDRNLNAYDIQFLKSTISTSYFLKADDVNHELLAESQVLEDPGSNRKNYIFFLDVGIIRSGDACGYAGYGEISAVVAIGSKCTQASHQFKNYGAQSWPHELMHNFGVKHTLDDPCDFMRGTETKGTCPWSSPLTIDKERTRYVGSSAQGQDILKLPVWAGYTAKDYWAKCLLNPVPRSDGFKYAYCPTGVQTIGALSYCWESLSSISLEEFVDGAWKSLGAGNHYSDPWGSNVSWHCNSGDTAPWKQLNVTNPGISLYRWMANGRELEQFKVIWVR
jgi:hypothetical protein